ncbi:MAG: hypothetical protein RL442_2099, partial [Pseudomonadota bacterium]
MSSTPVQQLRRLLRGITLGLSVLVCGPAAWAQG